MKKNILTITGFLLFVLGFVSLVLSMIGVQLAILAWLDQLGALFGFLFRLGMILGGVIIVVLGQTDWERERRESL